MTVRAGMRIPVQEVTAPPTSQVCSICWNWPALDLRRCNAGSGCLLAGLVGICGTGPAGLVERKANFKKIVNRMGRWPGYGRMAGLWGSAKTYGEIRQACGRMGKPRYLWGDGLRERPLNRMGEPRKRMGNGLRGRPRNRMGEPRWETCAAGIWGGRQAVWGAKNHIKTRNIGTVGGLWTLQILMNFWWEAAARHSLPSRLRTGPAANVAAPKILRLYHLALASS